MSCAGCGTAFDGPFCPHCGAAPGVKAAASPVLELRAGAYLIDVVPAMVASFVLGFYPVAGSTLAGVVLLLWWLLRDVYGASPGKRLLGLKVVRKDGGESGTRERILRNVTLIGGPLFMILPLASIGGTSAAGLMITMLEMAVLLIRKERIGD
jgi:uncharacterized RDD family membrane protein YckC